MEAEQPRKPWGNSNRKEELPKNWYKLRKLVLARDQGICTWDEWVEGKRVRCPEPATDVDHIVPGNNHNLSNLRALCRAHHARKSASEGGRAWGKQRKAIRAKFRRTEKHPGLV